LNAFAPLNSLLGFDKRDGSLKKLVANINAVLLHAINPATIIVFCGFEKVSWHFRGLIFYTTADVN